MKKANKKETKPRILVVEDHKGNLAAIERTLRDRYEVIGHTDPLQALRAVKKNDFAVVISDQRMPKMLGTELLAKISKLKPMITRVILTSFTETAEMLDAINRAEIYRYVTKPWDNDEFMAVVRQSVEHHELIEQNESLVKELRVQNRSLERKKTELRKLNEKLERKVEQRTLELSQANRKLSELAQTDPLTKILNRRAFFDRLTEEIKRSLRYKHTVSLAMIDVDHFKVFNDREGHLHGDEGLKKLAQVVSKSIRQTDFFGRYGGEEFVLMMPETEREVAQDTCERLRKAIEKASFLGKGGKSHRLTISIGLAAFPESGNTAKKLIEVADIALYQAKEAGRNQVVSV